MELAELLGAALRPVRGATPNKMPRRARNFARVARRAISSVASPRETAKARLLGAGHTSSAGGRGLETRARRAVTVDCSRRPPTSPSTVTIKAGG